ncbi:uncharacterized protein DEA37_0002369 [Paragonimus westermani]|uniref:Integrase catalytic domain-containing protein n=1 Tax=Paragonimus westermani TaxID=34504 RepID=A0A5J4NND9_9TREM|nr:uncharacterized protein DEA37_0002369 [Paragonimus westermani]
MVCKQYGTRQPKEPMVCRSVPKRPWQHVAVDLFSHADKSYLLLVDNFRDFLEIEELNATSAGSLKCTYALNHSQSNGKAESSVNEAKKIMKKCLTAKEDAYLALLERRNTPSADIVLSPVQRLMARRTRTRIPLVEGRLALQTFTWDIVRKRLKQRIERERQVYNKGTHELSRLVEGNTVWIQSFGLGFDRWAPGIVEGRDGDRSYMARTIHGTLRRHKVHLWKKETMNSSSGEREHLDKMLEYGQGQHWVDGGQHEQPDEPSRNEIGQTDEEWRAENHPDRRRRSHT